MSTNISTNCAAFGWEVRLDDDGATILDVAGAEQAHLALPDGGSATDTRPEIPRGGAVSLTVQGEQAILRNGIPGATRREEQTASVLVCGRRYEVVHTTPRRARVLCDGRVLGELTRVSPDEGAPVAVVAHEPFDRIDQLLVVVAQQFIRPGRPAVGEARPERASALTH